MKERPIFFKGEMIKAILAGRKTMTRRPIDERNFATLKLEYAGFEMYSNPKLATQYYFRDEGFGNLGMKCPYGEVGDLLWVKETYRVSEGTTSYFMYRADWSEDGMKWIPSVHMPKIAARIFLEITAIDVQRVQSITESDCIAEGMGNPITRDIKKPKFVEFWTDTYGEGAWVINPWVWVISFKKIER